MTDGSEVQKSGGNTGPRLRRYRFTEYHYEWLEEVLANDTMPDGIVFMVFQLEACPTTQRKHMQGYMELDKQVNLSTLKNKYSKTANWGKCDGDQASNIKYCTKNDTRIAGPWTFGEKKKQGQRNDILQACDRIKQGEGLKGIAMDTPEIIVKYHRGLDRLRLLVGGKRDGTQAVSVTYHYGPAGAGKSRAAFEQARQLGDYYVKEGNNKWWDGYDGEKIVIIDELRTGREGVQLATLLRWLDRYECKVETKGGTINLLATEFIITSTKTPEELCEFDEDPTQLTRRITKTINH